MANPTDTGYTGPRGGSLEEVQWKSDGATKLFCNSNGNMVVLKFTQSINSILQTSASSWQELKSSGSQLEIAIHSRMSKEAKSGGAPLLIGTINSTYPFGIAMSTSKVVNGNTFPSGSFYSNVSVTGTNSDDGSLIFPLDVLFNNAATVSNPSLTPNSSTWYFYIRNTKLPSSQYVNTFEVSLTKTTLTLNMERYYPIKVYDSTTSTFKDATPYVCQNGVFVPVTTKVYKNNSFN